MVRKTYHLIENTLKLWNYSSNMLDKVYKAMVKCLQVYRTAVHYQKFGNLVKLKVSPFKVS